MAYDSPDKSTSSSRKGGDSSTSKYSLEDLKEMFSTCSDAEQDQRAQMLDDLEFARLGQQWPSEIENLRKQEGRPTLTINKLPAFIKQVVNDCRQNRPQIKVKPVDGSGDRKTADVFAGLIRNIEVSSNSDIAYDTATDFAVSCGVGYFRVDVAYTSGMSFDKKLEIKRIPNVFSVYGDPLSKEATSKDWNKAFLVDMMTKKEFEYEFKGAEQVDWSSDDYSGLSAPWFDEDSILICEAWCREKIQRDILKLSDGSTMGLEEYKNIEGILSIMKVSVLASRKMDDFKITQKLMTGAEILDETSWVGKYIPIIPVYGEEINIEGKKTYNSLIHIAKDPQRMFNYWRTTATELVALAPKVPWVGEEGSFDVDGELAKWKNSNIKSYPFLQYKKGRPPPIRQMLDSGPAAGALTEAGHASDDMKATIGMYDASLGQRSNEVSGKAIMARQREGDVSTFHFVDNLSRAIQHCGTILVDLIPKVYTGERIVRIVDAEGKQKTVQLGPQPEQAPGVSGFPPGAPPPPPPGGAGASMPPMPGQPPQMGPTPMDEGIDGIFTLDAGEYDVVVDTGPSVTTRREELAIQMTEFTKVQPGLFPIIGDLMIKALDWPNADIIAERFTAMQQNQQKETEQEKELQRLRTENQVLKGLLPIKQGELEVEKFNAQTKRMAALKQEPDGGPDPVDRFNAETKRMSAMGQIERDKEGARKARADALLSSVKTANEIMNPPPPPKLNGGPK